MGLLDIALETATASVAVNGTSSTALSKQYVMINNYIIDCSLSENHTFESEVTDYPQESGSNISDNIRPKPIVVMMECLVSNSPIGAIAQLRSADGNSDAPVDAAYDVLKKIYKSRDTVTIRTSLATWPNMAMKNLTIPRATGRGDELRFTATFQQLQTVTNKRFTRVSLPRATGKSGNAKPLQPVAGLPIQVDTVTGDWFDPDIRGWRRSALYHKEPRTQKQMAAAVTTYDPTFGQSTELPGHSGFWSLVRGIPTRLSSW